MRDELVRPAEPVATDAELIRRAKAGDLEALGKLLSRDEKRRRGLIRRLARREEDVDEPLQESRVRAWRSFGAFREGSSFPAWYDTITRHVVADYYDGQDRRARGLSELRWFTKGMTTSSLASQCEARAGIKRVLLCITSNLAMDQQIAVILVECYQLRVAAAAQRMGLPVRTLERVLHEARITLRAGCGGRCALIDKTGIPGDCSPSHPPVVGGPMRPLAPRRLVKLRDQLVRELLFFDPVYAGQLIATARNW